MHYPNKIMSSDLFYAKVDTDGPNGCHIWRAAKNTGGYGQFRDNRIGRTYQAHRFAWIQKYGAIPAGMLVLHKCHNPACVNPDHLYIGTHADNMADMKAAQRQAKGVTNTKTKLTDQQVVLIRQQAATHTQTELAQLYDVSQAQINRIIKRKQR